MEQVLLVIHVIIAIALVGMVLIQRSDTDGFGLGSGSGSNLLSGRSTANFMTRTTAILAALFIINSLVLSIMASNRASTSLIDALEKEQPVTEAPMVEKPAAKPAKKVTPPSVPLASETAPVKKPAKAPAVEPAADEAADVSETE